MNIQRVSMLLLIFLFISCSPKKFAFRKTYDAASVQHVIKLKKSFINDDTISFQQNISPSISVTNPIANPAFGASPSNGVSHHIKPTLHPNSEPVLHHHKLTIATDPIPPTTPPKERNRGGNAGLVALMLLLLAG